MNENTNAHRSSATAGMEPLPEHVLRTRKAFVDLVANIVADAIPSHRYDVVGIAERLGLSEQTFRRRLYICTGYTPKQFITSIQMREAERLLSEYPDAKERMWHSSAASTRQARSRRHSRNGAGTARWHSASKNG